MEVQPAHKENQFRFGFKRGNTGKKEKGVKYKQIHVRNSSIGHKHIPENRLSPLN